jgi:hypothetical protein
LDKGNSNSVIKQNIDSFKITHPYIYDAFKDDPAKLAEMANAFLVPAKDPEMTALEQLEAPRKYDMLKTAFTDANRVSVVDQRAKDALDFGENYALDQRAKSLAAVSRAQKDPFTTLFDDGNVVPPIYNEPVLYNTPEENVGLENPMPTGARLDPYMDIPKVKQDDPIDDMVAGENLYPYTVTKGALEDPYDETPPVLKEALQDPYEETPPVLKEALQDPYDETPPALIGSGNKGAQGGSSETNTNTGVLGKKFTTTASEDRMSSPVTANARGSAMPFGKVGRNEMLMRMGSKMMAGSVNGHGAGMDAAFSEYGNIQDTNRQADTDAFNKAEATRLAEERIAALKAKSNAKKTDAGSVGNLRYGISKLQNGLDMIQNGGKNLTGVNAGAIFSRIYGKAVGSEAEAQRLFLKELGLDAIMKRVSQTKGAISNAEMKLFAQSAPDINSQEIVWESWINRQIQMSNILINRLETGGSVDENAKLSETMPSIKTDTGTTITDNNAMLNEADAIIGL